MANTFLRATTIARTAIGMLERELVLPRLVTRYGRADFAGQANDTITVRVPTILTAREYEFRTRVNPIVMDDIAEDSFPLTLNKHPYSAVAVTDEELTLDIASFATQVLAPQVRAVAEKLESYVATAMSTAPYALNHTIAMSGTTDEPRNIAVEARRLLNVANVPSGDRVLLLGANIEADFLKSDHLTKVSESGSDNALREGIIGRMAGFTVVGNVNSIDPNVGYAFHTSAFALANVAPVVPDGAVMGSSQAYGGLAMRWIRDYDPNYLRDRSVVSAFAGAGAVLDGPKQDIDAAGPGGIVKTLSRAVKINFTA